MTDPRSRIPLGPGGEFDLIRRLLGPEGSLPKGVLVGPGDDATVLEGGVVVSTDLTVEGVHFCRNWITLEEAGYRAAASALSDLAAMAAEPLGLLLSLALPAGDREGAPELRGGAWQACRDQGIQILGGDLSATAGPLTVDAVALGRARAPVLRAGSLPGDELWVTGHLGGSGGAVRLWKGGHEPPPGLRMAFAHPWPRIREALWLAGRLPLHGLLDLSDGLAGDAGHLAAASGTAVVLEGDAIPVHPELAAAFPDPAHRLHFALSGGEDYELCLSAPAGSVGEWTGAFQEVFGIPLTRVGRVEEGEGVFLEEGPERRSTPMGGGFSHFGPGEDV